jgi:2',3'-cyclic-nucleotide 2'-phosphodiesterase (5'-nucleotidase family)
MKSPLRILPALVLLVLTGCVTAPAAQTAKHSTRFKILQINDVYKIEGLEGGQLGGLARVRSLRKQLESDGTTVFVLHGGDLLFPSVMSKYLEAKPMVDVLNLLDGDGAKFDTNMLVGFGNHELDLGDDKILLARIKESQFQWVVSNTYHCTAPNVCTPFRTVGAPVAEIAKIDVGDLAIGFIGLLYPLQKPYAYSSNVVAAARDAHMAFSDTGGDLTIAITHEDMADDVTLARELPGIDVIVGGHDHLFMQQRVGSTWITKADADAKSVIVYDITVDDEGVHTAPLRVVLDTTVPKDPDVDARVQEWLGKLSEKLGGNETLGQTQNLLEGIEPAVRGRETALGNLMTDAAREKMGTDIAVLNGGSIRINDNIPPGPIKKYDMEGIFYYTNSLVAFRMTGQQLLDMLRNSVSRADAGDGRFLQLSGMSFTYHAQGNGFTVDAPDVTVGGKPLDLNATYSVATIDYMYRHGTDDGYTLFADATRPVKTSAEPDPDFRGTVEAYIRARGTVETDVEGRIKRR